jgi:Transcriptional regulator
MKDRRIEKTEQAIQTAFAKLLREKDLEKITVKSLCEMANINKSTFYLHYKDIYDCADRLRDDIINELSKVITPYNLVGIINNFASILENMMDVFEKNKDLYMPFLKSPSLSSSLCKMKHSLIDKALEKVNDTDLNDGMSRCSVSFVMGGIITLLEQYDFSEIKHQTILILANQVKNGFTH